MNTNSLITEYLEYLEHSCGFAIRTLKVYKRVCNIWDQFLSTKGSKQITGATPADLIDYVDFRQQSGKIKNVKELSIKLLVGAHRKKSWFSDELLRAHSRTRIFFCSNDVRLKNIVFGGYFKSIT